MGLVIFWSTIDPRIDCESLIGNQKAESYTGTITRIFVDHDQHMYKKVVLNKSVGSEVVLMNWDSSGLFEYLKVGDSVAKETETLEVKIWRNNTDTLYNLTYKCID